MIVLGSIETCEPAGIEYAVDSFNLIAYDPKKFASYFNKVWQNDIQLSVQLCRRFQIDPAKIISHREGFLLGLATNHKDRSFRCYRSFSNAITILAGKRLFEKPWNCKEEEIHLWHGLFCSND